MTREQLEAMFKLMAGQVPYAPPATIPPANIPGYGGPMPEVSVEQFGPKPQYNMGVTLPTGGVYDASAQGSFTAPDQWKALFGFKRQF